MVGILLSFVRWPKNLLNAGVSCRKYGNRSDLGEQVHQARDRSRIELLNGLDQPASEIFIGERLAQPLELLHGPFPRHRIGQTSLVAQLFFHQDPLIFGMDGDSGIEFFRIASGEMLVGLNVHSCEQRLRIRRLNACRFNWAGPT